MTDQTPRPPEPSRIALDEVERFAFAALDAVHVDAESSEALVRALSHASLHGVDTHGYRLLPHYLAAFAGGRLNPRPSPRMVQEKGGAGVLDGDDAHGARVTYLATEQAMRMARGNGVGAVAIRNSSHFGAAGAYALDIARAGMMGFAVCNSDPFVRLHDGAARIHGTNPIAVAAPAGDGDPWLLDMATSAIPFNRVRLCESLGIPLPPGTASDADGQDVCDPALADMLAPLGGAFGYKGAGLAGLAELLSSALSDAPLSVEIAPMVSDDMATPRGLGAFVLALDPAAFAGAEVFFAVVRRYLDTLRGGPVRTGGTVMAAGDREWAEAAHRKAAGITLDPAAIAALADFARIHGIAPLHGAGGDAAV